MTGLVSAMSRSDRMYTRILRNALKCCRCFEVIESGHVHDFRYCKCKSWFVDGGKEYIRRGGAGLGLGDSGNDIGYWDLSEYAE